MPRPRFVCSLILGHVILAVATGCSMSQGKAMTEAESKSVRDTVIALEHATNLAVDRLDCGAAFGNVGNREPMFVSNALLFRKRAAFRNACDGMIVPRAGAVFAVDTVTAHALSRDAAYVVSEGIYTITMKDGTSVRQQLIMTSIWARQAESWKMAHLHESYQVLKP